jgi:hypothetical protein
VFVLVSARVFRTIERSAASRRFPPGSNTCSIRILAMTRTERGTIEGDLELSEHLELHGIINGDAIVCAGGRIDLHGMVCGDLTFETGSCGTIDGTVRGDLTNRGGVVVIRGVVDGELRELSGRTVVDADAIIGARRGRLTE